MENINIKKATINDLSQLQKIGRDTFSQTFSATNGQEDMDKYLEESFSSGKMTEELNSESQFYFAVLENQIIGYLKLNFGQSQTEIKDDKALEIERIYVLQEYHGKKVGQLLYAKAMAVATEASAEYIWLGVWEENQKAISFYKKNGFIAFDKHIFKLGNDEQTDIMMKKVL
ncbi:GNAT family N-acetyltransferase [Pedobacter antarcticus]|uniref:GNAT family N-acetyltransferase n=2 Tax=Pedobacter antarcticus TaxID=34086 RepID=UPI001C57D640|nr:N-acetyltransferase [Pedobacter antarcticus]